MTTNPQEKDCATLAAEAIDNVYNAAQDGKWPDEEVIASIIRQHITPLLRENEFLAGIADTLKGDLQSSEAARLRAEDELSYVAIALGDAFKKDGLNIPIPLIQRVVLCVGARQWAEEERDLSNSATTQAIRQHDAMSTQAEMASDECAREMVARVEAEAKLAKAEAQIVALKEALEESHALNVNVFADGDAEMLSYYSEYRRVIKMGKDALATVTNPTP